MAWCHVWVGFVTRIGSSLSPRVFFPGGFSSSTESNISKFKLDQDMPDVASSLNIEILLNVAFQSLTTKLVLRLLCITGVTHLPSLHFMLLLNN